MIDFVFKKIIDNSLLEQKLGQVYLFSSKNIKSFDEYFLYFINNVNGECFEKISDIKLGDIYFYVDGRKNTIGKENILDVMNETTETSLLSKNKKKILIIDTVENGTQQSLNSLLKFLENPPQNTVVLMSCNYISQVISTIKSRAFIIELNNTLNTRDINEFKPFKNFFVHTNSEYNEDIIPIFTELSKSIVNSNKEPQKLLVKIISHFNYDNKEVIINFMIMAFMDIYKVKKGFNDLLILNDYKIQPTSFDYVPIYKILCVLQETKVNLKNAANFNLQKAILLLKLEEFYGV
ncbi:MULTISPECIES: hypothetical protein [unclassified Mycoplasma]